MRSGALNEDVDIEIFAPRRDQHPDPPRPDRSLDQRYGRLGLGRLRRRKGGEFTSSAASFSTS
jgi:hypothetical protein